MPVIELDGNSVEYTVRDSRRAKRVHLSLSLEKGLEVIYPSGQQHPVAPELLRGHARWVISNLERIRKTSKGHFRRQYEEGESFLVRGENFYLKLYESSDLKRAKAALRGDSLELTMPSGTPLSSRAGYRDAVIDFYRQLAHDYLPPRVAELASEHGFAYKKLRIKNQKTRWGSCSFKGNINLNLRLMMAPAEVSDYVIVHELCHIRELNHSRAFWLLVAACCPDFRTQKDWLLENRMRLVL